MFKSRDLLIVAALMVGVVCGAYRTDILRALDNFVDPIDYYVDAPAREADMQASIKSLSTEVASLRASVDDRSNQLLHTQQLLEAQDQMARHSKAMFDLRIQRLREICNEADVDTDIAGFVE